MKNLLLFSPLLLAICSCSKDSQTTENNPEEKPKQIQEKELPPIPDKVTLEYVKGLWSQPHDESNVIPQIKEYMLAGKWKNIRTFSPNNGTISVNELSLVIKNVDQRFLVYKSKFEKLVQKGAVSLEGYLGTGVITYDLQNNEFKRWDFNIDGNNDGLEASWIGRPSKDFKTIIWESLELPIHPPEWRMEFNQSIDPSENKLIAHGKMLNGEEMMGQIKDEMIFVEANKEEPLDPVRETESSDADAKGLESQLVGKWVANVMGAKALFTFPATERQEWSWYNKETFPDVLEYGWEVRIVNSDSGYSFGPSLFKFSDAEGPVKGSLSELIGVCQHDLWKLSEDGGESIGSYGQTKVTENKVHLMVTNKTLIDYLLESKPVHVEMSITTPTFNLNEKVPVDYESPTALKEREQEIK
jgi:hypothetical protein